MKVDNLNILNEELKQLLYEDDIPELVQIKNFIEEQGTKVNFGYNINIDGVDIFVRNNWNTDYKVSGKGIQVEVNQVKLNIIFSDKVEITNVAHIENKNTYIGTNKKQTISLPLNTAPDKILAKAIEHANNTYDIMVNAHNEYLAQKQKERDAAELKAANDKRSELGSETVDILIDAINSGFKGLFELSDHDSWDESADNFLELESFDDCFFDGSGALYYSYELGEYDGYLLEIGTFSGEGETENMTLGYDGEPSYYKSPVEVDGTIYLNLEVSNGEKELLDFILEKYPESELAKLIK